MTTANIKLIGTAASRVMRNIWMLTELNLPYEHDQILANDAALKAPPYGDWNPNGRIPILLVDDFAIHESLAINLYLDSKFPSAISLYTLEEKALGIQWALWALTDVEAHSFNWFLNTSGKPEFERDAVLATQSWEKLQKPFTVLEKTLTAHEYLLGDRFTVADLNTAGVLYRALSMPLDTFPQMRAWLDRCWAREAGRAARIARGEKP